MVLYYLLTTLYVVVCLVLLLVILLQQGKGGDMASAFGGGNSQAAFGARGGATLLSKITSGFAVLFMIFAMMGYPIAQGEGGDRFKAFRIPPSAEGGKPAMRAFAEEAFAVLFTVLLVFVLLGEIFMPWLMTVIAPGFSAEPGKFDLVVMLTRITFPYLLFISLTALQGGVLNTVDRFAAPAATPILLNLFLIAGLVLMAHFHWQDGQVLAWA